MIFADPTLSIVAAIQYSWLMDETDPCEARTTVRLFERVASIDLISMSTEYGSFVVTGTQEVKIISIEALSKKDLVNIVTGQQRDHAISR